MSGARLGHCGAGCRSTNRCMLHDNDMREYCMISAPKECIARLGNVRGFILEDGPIEALQPVIASSAFKPVWRNDSVRRWDDHASIDTRQSIYTSFTAWPLFPHRVVVQLGAISIDHLPVFILTSRWERISARKGEDGFVAARLGILSGSLLLISPSRQSTRRTKTFLGKSSLA